MAYDPTKPANGAPILSAELREQFQGLKTLMDELPQSQAMQDRIFQLSSGPCDAVSQLNLTVSDPPTQAEMQTIADKIDELIFHLRRL